ncbi:MAG TPA: iron-sulfur cluster insertion protein ErpA [Microthrixaceae bacterium]|nr:iron-sulfur cluster insertion protein ErpA [Microthrixaceae bacterium]
MSSLVGRVGSLTSPFYGGRAPRPRRACATGGGGIGPRGTLLHGALWVDRRSGGTLTVASRHQEAQHMITLTDSAAVKVRQLIESEGEENLALRVAVRPGGCSGFSYEMFFDTDIAADDLSSEFDGVKVVVDPSSAQLLTGAELDYKDSLEKSGFEINNPNAQKTCGCGSSFS